MLLILFSIIKHSKLIKLCLYKEFGIRSANLVGGHTKSVPRIPGQLHDRIDNSMLGDSLWFLSTNGNKVDLPEQCTNVIYSLRFRRLFGICLDRDNTCIHLPNTNVATR